MSHGTLGRCLLAFTAALAVAACSLEPRAECRRNRDCDDGQRCELEFCVPAVGVDSADAGGTATNASPSNSGPSQNGGASGGGSDPESGGNGESGSESGDEDAGETCPDGRAPNGGELVVNEILVDVPTGSAGDANADGTRDAFEDEFVELVNRSETTLDLKGVRLTKGGDVKTGVGEVCLAPGGTVVVFGGGAPSLPAADQPDTHVRVAETRFTFPNSGGRFAVVRADGAELTSFEWSDPPSESLTLAPQVEGSTHLPHSEVGDGRKTSPGRCADGDPIANGCGDEADDSGAGDVGVDANSR